jgi:outer membrane receptor for ferrienterochelin and colicin
MNTQSWKFAGYIEHIVQLNDHLLLNMGGRFDYFDLSKEVTWSPRMNLAYQIGGGLTVRGAWGYYYQSPNYRQVAYPSASDTNTQSQKAIHYVLGVDYAVSLDPEARSFLKLKVECFYKNYENLMSATQTSNGYVSYSRKNDAFGDSKGADVYLMCSVPGFYGWISYSYLKAMQDILNDHDGSFPRNTDQRHTLAIVSDLDLGSEWNLAMRYIYGSGYPSTPMFTHRNSATNDWEWNSGAPNSERLPSYSCMDMRITKSFRLFGFVTSTFLDISNLLDAKNILAYRYYINNNNPVKDGEGLPPLIPSIGMSIQF